MSSVSGLEWIEFVNKNDGKRTGANTKGLERLLLFRQLLLVQPQ